MFEPAPLPNTRLGNYRLLSPNAGIHISPLQLGAMSIGDQWNKGMGEMSRESSFKLLDAYYEAGGNVIDTSNGYQDESSERFIGEWMEKRGIRDQMVIATKYSGNFKQHDPAMSQKILYMGNSNKSLHLSVEASLKKLRTTYIDIFYVHWWDYVTSIEEVMNSLHTLIEQRKVLYLGVSDTPAWVVAQANQYARDHGKTPFVIYQGLWNVMQRDFERDILPMARLHGMALAPFNVLSQGKLRSADEDKKRTESGEGGRTQYTDWRRTETEIKMSEALEKVGNELGGKSVSAVAIAYVMHKAPFVFPIIGGRKLEHLYSNIEALDVSLSKEQVEYLESIVPLQPGFPNFIIGDGTDYNYQFKSIAQVDKQPLLAPVPHH